MTFKQGNIPWNKGLSRKCPWMIERNKRMAKSKQWAKIKEKISKALTGKPKPDGFGDKISLVRKGVKVYCPPEAHIKQGISISGKNNPNWKGGRSRFRGSGWERIRKIVLERDNFTCQHCGVTGVRLHAHHIIPYRISENNSLDNLIILCTSHHTKADASIPYCHFELSDALAGEILV